MCRLLLEIKLQQLQPFMQGVADMRTLCLAGHADKKIFQYAAAAAAADAGPLSSLLKPKVRCMFAQTLTS